MMLRDLPKDIFNNMPSQFYRDKILLLSSLVICILVITPLYAQESSVLEQEDVIFLFDERLGLAAKEAAEFYPAIRKELEKALGWKINFRPTVILVSDNNAFQRMTGNDLIVAFAVPDRDLMVIDYSKMKTDPFTLEATMKHELCHLLLHKNIGSENLPRWLDEGIAQWVSGGLADIVINNRSLLDEAILSDRYISIKALTERFPENGKSLILAYEESKSIIEYIVREYGPGGILMVLGYLKDGDGLNSAVIKSFSISFDELERRWYNRLKKRTIWLIFLANNLYGILFFLAALVLIYGFIKVLVKKRSFKRDGEDNI